MSTTSELASILKGARRGALGDEDPVEDVPLEEGAEETEAQAEDVLLDDVEDDPLADETEEPTSEPSEIEALKLQLAELKGQLAASSKQEEQSSQGPSLFSSFYDGHKTDLGEDDLATMDARTAQFIDTHFLPALRPYFGMLKELHDTVSGMQSAGIADKYSNGDEVLEAARALKAQNPGLTMEQAMLASGATPAQQKPAPAAKRKVPLQGVKGGRRLGTKPLRGGALVAHHRKQLGLE